MVAVRADVLRATPLPEDYFLYWEELEWFWRLRAGANASLIVPSAAVIHDGGRVDVRPEKSRPLARNAVRCVRRTQGRSAALGVLLVVVAWNLRLVAADLVGPCACHPTPVVPASRTMDGPPAAVESWSELR